MVPSGCYLSTDQGVTWKNLCGVPDLYWPMQRFYVKDKSLYVFGNDSNSSFCPLVSQPRLPQPARKHIRFSPIAPLKKAVTPGQKVTREIFFAPTPDPIGIDSAHIVIHFDSTSLLLDSLALPDSWVIRDSTSGSSCHDLCHHCRFVSAVAQSYSHAYL